MKRARDLAAELGISEGELVARSLGSDAIRLSQDHAKILLDLPRVGRCMALTRNEPCVSEVKGRYGGIELGAHAGQVIGQAIDLRVFLTRWHAAFEVKANDRRSVQIFDRTGTAVHKVYLEPDGELAAWERLIETHRIDPVVPTWEAATVKTETPDREIDRDGLARDWDAMTDTHEFFHLLAKHRASRTQALRLAGDERARAVRNNAIELLLHEAVESGERIMIFVGNPGCIQVFSGAIANVVRHGPWLNVLDPGFNLHLRDDLVAASWVVAKPTRSGVVRSLELYDRSGETIALVFAKRDDRERAENPAWQQVLERLPEVRA
ncbi:MAG TPA: ChuX/HutX family heme-like substrate-binding protein [Kofleriaceae bacterium]